MIIMTDTIHANFHYNCLAGNILSKLDESADPCDDMVRFSCGKWLDETEIPGDKSRYGNFDTLQDLIKTTLRSKMFIQVNTFLFFPNCSCYELVTILSFYIF